MLQTLLATAEANPVTAIAAAIGGFVLPLVLHFSRVLLTRQAATAEVQRTAASAQAIREEAFRHRATDPEADVPMIQRTIEVVYHVNGRRYVRELDINVSPGDPSPAVVTVWYRREDPGSAVLGTIAYGMVNSMISIACAMLAWAATMTLIRP